MATLTDKFKSLFQWFAEYDDDSVVHRLVEGGGTRGHIIRGFLKAFLVYLVPMTVLARQVTFRNVKRSLALGVFVSGVRAVDSVLKLTSHPEHGAEEITWLRRHSLGIAAGLSSFIALTIDGDLPQSLLVVLWIACRAFRAVVTSTGVPFMSTIVMCASAAQILTSYVLTPDELSPSYYKFLVLHGGKSETKVLDVLKTTVTDGCGTVHPGQGCLEHLYKFWFTEYLKAAKIYIPVFSLSLALSQKKNLQHWLVNILRSSAFLATYCSLAWFSPMCFFNHRLRPGTPMTKFWYYCTLWVAGLSTLIEREPRRTELATYCFTYAAESVLRHIQKRGFLVLFPTLNLFVMSICLGVLVHNHDQQPKEIVRFLFKLSHT